MEIWKDIIGYEESHQVSNMGRVRTKDRYANVGGGGRRRVSGKVIKPAVCTNGYLEAHLSVNGERKVFLLHRLVATHFIDNINGLPEVNHKDENIKNCAASNLEWCTSKYNANYGTRNERMMQGRTFRKIRQYGKNGELIREWNKMSDAAREVGADISSIIRVCKGKQNTSMGYRWEYVEVAE